jgi:mannobiose 2-epimerase
LAVVGWSGVAVAASARSVDAPAPVPDLPAYAAAAEREVRTDILPFWLRHAPDREHGGFVGFVGLDMKPKPDAPRGTLMISRILWTFSAAYRRFHDPKYLEIAQQACRELTTHGFDREQGGLFWSFGPDGRPVETFKHVYDQSFGIYALSELYRTTHDRAALDEAIGLYRLVEQKARDHQHGGYFESFTRNWTRDDAAQRRILGGVGAKSQNTHIHLLEAYTNLLRVWPDPRLRDDLRALLDLMLSRIIDPKTRHLVLYFDETWTPVSDEISFGHDIELSWLAVEAANVLGDPTMQARAKATALEMAAVTLAQGVDPDGGMLNEANSHGLTNTNKDWWPQAEATVGFLNAYQLSGDTRYLAASRHAWDFIEARCIDRKNGDWYESVTRDGTPRNVGSKISVWKCPYHNSRACLEIMERVERIEASNAKARNSKEPDAVRPSAKEGG